MIIGFDAKRAVQNNTGLGNYSRYLVEILSKYYPDNTYLLFAPKNKKNNRLQALKEHSSVQFSFPQGIWKLFPSWWRTSGIKKDLIDNRVDIFHGLSNELPTGIRNTGIKSIVTIHDLIFLRYPEYYKPIDRKIYEKKFKYACQKADKIIAISECTKCDIINFFDIPENNIEVIYQGCHPSFYEIVENEVKKKVLEKYSLPEKFILSVGSIESRKNLMLSVKALRNTKENIHLVAIGKKTPYQDEIEAFCAENRISDRVHLLNNVPFCDLPALYQSAKIFVYTSFFEGFGIPVIEALAGGIPVIAATGSCLEEAGGPDSIYVDPNNEQELAEKIDLILNNQELATSMSVKGKKYVENFSDKCASEKIINLYKSL